jgi:Mg-chelatase subunit ChlD
MLRFLCALSFAISSLLSPLAAQQGMEARLDAVKEFLKYFKKNEKEEAQLVEAVMILKDNECVQAADELFKLLKHPMAAVQQAALTVLETYKSPSTYEAWLQALPKEKDSDRVALVIKVVGRAKIAGAVDAIEAAAAAPSASAVVKFEAARALQAIGDPGKTPLLANLLGDKEGLVRMAALDAVAALKVKTCGKQIVALLGDNEWQVQTAAIAAAAATRPQEAVQPLIDLMRKSGRLRTECAEALFKITAYDFGVDPERWQTQWNSLMSIGNWRIPTDDEMKKKAEARKRSEAFYGKRSETNAFVGIKTTSTNVLFIIDVSGSMDDLVVEVDKFRDYPDRRKFTIVQKQLLEAIDSLTPSTNFNICAFATDIKPWKPGLVAANVVYRDAAKSWVKNLKPIGGTEDQYTALAGLGGAANLDGGKTNTLKALLYAFGVDPDKPGKAVVTGFDKNAVKSPLDTVYFLSDGRPSVGKLIETNEILKEVRRHNEVYRMVIHTIAIGDFTKEFLKQLAEENGGVFVDMGR